MKTTSGLFDILKEETVNMGIEGKEKKKLRVTRPDKAKMCFYHVPTRLLLVRNFQFVVPRSGYIIIHSRGSSNSVRERDQ
jgi:hypothetical protein